MVWCGFLTDVDRQVSDVPGKRDITKNLLIDDGS
jgi:hypothetical protein